MGFKGAFRWAVRGNKAAVQARRVDGPLAPIPFSLHPDYDRRPRDHTGSADLDRSSAKAEGPAKRSRAMRIARNYRRWGVTPRPENVAASLSGGGHFVSQMFQGCIDAFC